MKTIVIIMSFLFIVQSAYAGDSPVIKNNVTLEQMAGIWECDGKIKLQLSEPTIGQYTFSGIPVSSGSFKGLGVDNGVSCHSGKGRPTCEGIGKGLGEDGDLYFLNPISFRGSVEDGDEELKINISLLGPSGELTLECQRK